jgi:peptidyl-prolyl cis-trans isomerase C
VKTSVRCLVVICVLSLSVAALAQTQPKPRPAPAKASPPPVTTPAADAPAQEEQIPPAAPDAIFPAVVARVNGKAILGRDLEQRIQGQLAPIGNPKWENLREDYRLELTTQALGSLVGTELLYQKAVSSGIKATEAEVQAEFAKIAKSFPSDAELNANLASRGLDRAALNKDLERSLVVEKFVQEYVAKKISVTPADATQYYSQHTDEFRHDDIVRSSHIFIQVAEGATPEQDRIARQRAESILARLRKGEDFAKLAKENSMDGSASQGGDLGYLPKGQLTPQFEAVAFSLPVGTISDVVRTPFGYHVIKVTDRKSAGVSPIEEVRDDLVNFLKQQKTDAELQKIVTDLRSQAKITISIPIGARQSQPTVSSPRP